MRSGNETFYLDIKTLQKNQNKVASLYSIYGKRRLRLVRPQLFSKHQVFKVKMRDTTVISLFFPRSDSLRSYSLFFLSKRHEHEQAVTEIPL